MSTANKHIIYISLIIIHLIIGWAIYMSRGLSKIFLLVVVVYFLINTLFKKNRNDEVLIAAAYITGFEVFSRMTGGAFSYEFAKYAVMGFLVFGMFYKGFNKKSYAYIIFLLLLVPGILFSAMNLSYDENIANAIGFNLSGPFCLAISALYCYRRRVTSKRFQEILLAVLLPLISMTVYLYLYTPSIRDIITGTSSNFEASGGYGPNQVATVLGLAMFILFSRLMINKNRAITAIDLVLLAFISYRAIVTFSRGGVFVAALCAIVFLVMYYLNSDKKEKSSLFQKVIFIIALMAMTWTYSSINTKGFINKRYANQDAAGREKEDITSGRVDLLDTELKAFIEFPITGVGVGKTKEFRQELTGEATASHNEMSRMLSEHGLFGLFALVILLITPIIYRLKDRSNLYLYSFLIFWFLTINHSSMRIAAPAFIYGLCLITLLNEKKNSLYRK